MTLRTNCITLLTFGLGLFATCHPIDAAKISGPEDTLYQHSIKTTKQSLTRETLEVFYHDALDDYHEGRYAEALETLDKIYSLDPHYEDVAKLRETIRRAQSSQIAAGTRDSVRGLMQKGNDALRAGQNGQAVSFWKQALQIDPRYAPAKKKITEVNHALAQREFEAGYIHYHHGEMEDALDSWSNAIALDPTYKQRGLLLLMSKIELHLRDEQVGRLATQGYDQFQAGEFEQAAQSYSELLKLQPRHEEARRMAAKIKLRLGEAAFKKAQSAFAHRAYSDAIQNATKAISYGYEVSRSEKIKNDSVKRVAFAKHPPKPARPIVASTRPAVQVSSPAATTAVETSAPQGPRNPEEAMMHYRKGLAAIRTKDYCLALQELENANQMDPSNDRVYIARERARQECTATSSPAGAKEQ